VANGRGNATAYPAGLVVCPERKKELRCSFPLRDELRFVSPSRGPRLHAEAQVLEAHRITDRRVRQFDDQSVDEVTGPWILNGRE
jgi:hypothetical protein